MCSGLAIIHPPNYCWESFWRWLLRSLQWGVLPLQTFISWGYSRARSIWETSREPPSSPVFTWKKKKCLPSSSSTCNHFSNIVINRWILSTFYRGGCSTMYGDRTGQQVLPLCGSWSNLEMMKRSQGKCQIGDRKLHVVLLVYGW